MLATKKKKTLFNGQARRYQNSNIITHKNTPQDIASSANEWKNDTTNKQNQQDNRQQQQ